jgi:hypothetical protein
MDSLATKVPGAKSRLSAGKGKAAIIVKVHLMLICNYVPLDLIEIRKF